MLTAFFQRTAAGNGATWAFGGGVPMGSAGLQNQRPNNGPMTSFAQIGGSQPATPLDLSLVENPISFTWDTFVLGLP